MATKNNSEYTQNSRQRKIIEEGKARFDGFVSQQTIESLDAMIEEMGFTNRAQAMEYLVARAANSTPRASTDKMQLVLRAEGYCTTDIEACLRAALPMIRQGMRVGDGAGFAGAFNFELSDASKKSKKADG